MTSAPTMHPEAWDEIELVVFDVDGTLYDQRRLRALMARDLLLHLVTRGDLRLYRILSAYRGRRERWGEREAPFGEEALIAETAAATGVASARVQEAVAEWMARRPLPYLAGCRYAGLAELFEALRRSGKKIGIFSDYPARDKLAALGVSADDTVSAGDPGVGFLKPHPRGLQLLMERAAVKPEATVLIGDRAERDGLAARRAGARSLIRSARRIAGWQTFARYDDALFAPLQDAKKP
ncbi:MAG TPA: HAD family hydrolase [Geomonas sp.]|nr:HAD family hydrolase [Geomonas sp.]